MISRPLHQNNVAFSTEIYDVHGTFPLLGLAYKMDRAAGSADPGSG